MSPTSRPASRSSRTARRRFERRRKIAGYVALVALGSVLVGTLISSGTGSRDTASTTSTSTLPVTTTSVDPATLPPVAKELYALIQQGRANGYHLVLSVSGSALPTTITEASIEVWRLGPRVRHDTRLVEPTGTTVTVDIGGPDGTIQCDTPAGATLTCTRTSTDPIGPDDDFLGFVVQNLATVTVEGRDDMVGGTAARCYRIGVTGTEICLTSNGVPLRISEPTFVEEARVVETTVDPAVFQPPAPVG